MKNILIFIFVLAGLPLVGQDLEIPATVLSAFSDKFPDAEEVVWKQRKDTYQAEFFDFDQTIAFFDVEGTWVKTITMISEEDLPENISVYITDNYDLDDISAIHLVETNKQVVSYRVMLMTDTGKLSLEFSEEGALLKTSK